MQRQNGDHGPVIRLHLHLHHHPRPQHRPPALQHLGKHRHRVIVGRGRRADDDVVPVGPGADGDELVLVPGAGTGGEDGDALAGGLTGDPLDGVAPLLAQVSRLQNTNE